MPYEHDDVPEDGKIERPTKTNTENECPWIADGGEYADDIDEMPDNS